MVEDLVCDSGCDWSVPDDQAEPEGRVQHLADDVEVEIGSEFAVGDPRFEGGHATFQSFGEEALPELFGDVVVAERLCDQLSDD